MQNSFPLTVLQVMYAEARRSKPPGRKQLCSLLGASEADVATALVALERAGLATAGTTRLTLIGLALAAASPERCSVRAPGRRFIAA